MFKKHLFYMSYFVEYEINVSFYFHKKKIVLSFGPPQIRILVPSLVTLLYFPFFGLLGVMFFTFFGVRYLGNKMQWLHVNLEAWSHFYSYTNSLHEFHLDDMILEEMTMRWEAIRCSQVNLRFMYWISILTLLHFSKRL